MSPVVTMKYDLDQTVSAHSSDLISIYFLGFFPKL